MIYIKTGVLKANALDLPTTTQPLERAELAFMKRLNFLLGFLQEQTPDTFAAFVDKLNARYQGEVKVDILQAQGIDLDDGARHDWRRQIRLQE